MAINFAAPPKDAPKSAGTKAVVTQTITGKLPAMIRAAADKLATATTAAEILDARDDARMTYSTAQVAGRIAKAKGAHDQVVAAAHRAQADALEIEAAAKRRLADEYDAAQPADAAVKGRPKKSVPVQNAFSAEAVGLTRKDVHDARRVRNAEKVSPGVVRKALDQAIEEGKEPSRAVVNEAVAEVLGEEKPKRERPADPLQSAWDAAGEAERDAFLARNNLTRIPAGSAARGQAAQSGECPEAPPMDGARKGPSGTAAIDSNSSTTSSRKTNKPEAVTPPAVSGPILKPLSKADQIRLLRPNCKHADDLEKCAGSGRRHCRDCEVVEAAA